MNKKSTAVLAIVLTLIAVLCAYIFFIRNASRAPIIELKSAASTLWTPGSYDTAIGQNFRIGPFETVTNQQSNGGLESNCSLMKGIIVATLEDMQKHMEPRAISLGLGNGWNSFSVNQETVDLLCNKNVIINMADDKSNLLILEKIPFARNTSPDGSGKMGTDVVIYAGIVPKGAPTPKNPDEYGHLFVPDDKLPMLNGNSSSGIGTK